MVTQNSNRISIPKEIRTFFGRVGGRSLLVKGTAGTGKTTFALQLLEELADPNMSFYLSTRVSDQALFRQFPWLKEGEMRGRIIDASRVLLQKLYSPEEEEAEDSEATERLTSARDFLRSVSDEPLAPPGKVDRTRLTVLLERNRMPEIERVYDNIEANLPEKSMLIIDSVEGISNKYSLDSDELVTCMQKDLVESSNADLLFVLEDTEAKIIEFLVDGVIWFSHGVKDGRRTREMHLEKLRATQILQPSYLITLKDGRFTSFDPYTLGDVAEPKMWEPIPDTETHYSTGITSLDELLSGGYATGSYNVIEVDENVSKEEHHSIIRPILLNFISQNKGIFAVLSGGDHAESFKKDIERFIPEGLFENSVRIADYFIPRSDASYVMALGTRNKDEAVRIWKSNQEALRGSENRPIIDFTGFDTLEYLQGGGVAIKQLLDAVAKIKISKDIGIGVLKPGLKLTQEIMNMADTYLKITSIGRCPCLYGIKPKTMIYGIVNDVERGPPNIRLVPIV
jgi:KaiC/GvpD/RAD55 family RecA-like ATPase